MTTPERSVEEIVQIFQHEYGQYTSLEALSIASDWLRNTLHQELQKAREEERERIEAIFKEHVPPHAMDLEDSVWLKRLLNKAFGHENIY